MQTSGKQDIHTRIYSTYDNGNVPYIQQNQRRQLSIPTLSLQGSLMKNIGLVCDRGSKLSQIDNIFITDSIIDLHLVGSGSYVFPLYLTQRI
nr:hypothetical protein [Helicobacter bilis]